MRSGGGGLRTGAVPIYEYYCADTHTVYQFYAKTLAQGKTVPKCPDNPKFRMKKVVSTFAFTKGGKDEETARKAPVEEGSGPDDARMEAAMGAMEKEFAGVDENDPRAMGRMMRRMAEMSGEKIDGEMEEVVRKLEEGADPESLEAEMGGDGAEGEGMGAPGASSTAKKVREARARFKARRLPATRDPKLYDYA